MFFEVLFSFIFYARAIKPVLTIGSFVFVFSKLKLNYKYLIGLFIPMPGKIFHVRVFLKNNLFRVDTIVSSRKYDT